MKVKKNKTKQLNISEVDKSYVIIVKHSDIWHIMQAVSYESDEYLLLILNETSNGNNGLTVKNARSIGRTVEYWFYECQEMHAFKTTKEAFKFLIKKL